MPTPEEMRKQEAEVKHLALIEAAKVRGAEAKSPKDWMELFREITEHSVKTMMEANGQGGQVLQQLAPWRGSFVVVSQRLNAHGMPLSEEIEVEGPIIGRTANGLPIVDEWPTGVWVKFHWPDRSFVGFKGNDAIVAVSFWMWWADFQHVHMKQMDIAKVAEGKTRLILPGSAESIQYHQAKREDQSK